MRLATVLVAIIIWAHFKFNIYGGAVLPLGRDVDDGDKLKEEQADGEGDKLTHSTLLELTRDGDLRIVGLDAHDDSPVRESVYLKAVEPLRRRE